MGLVDRCVRVLVMEVRWKGNGAGGGGLGGAEDGLGEGWLANCI